MERKKIDIQKVFANEGQIEGLPRNPRTIALVQQQYGINLNDYRTDRTRSFGGRRGIQVDWDAMPQNVKNAITRLSTRSYSTFRILDNGAGMKLLKFK